MALLRSVQLPKVLLKGFFNESCPVCHNKLPFLIRSTKLLFQTNKLEYNHFQRRSIGSTYQGSFYRKTDEINEDEPRPAIEESREDFKHVLRLIPMLEVPEPPKHDQYPTPSGWSPPSGPADGTSFAVRRTKFHSVPVYTIQKSGGSQILTYINKIEGDIWAFANELSDHLNEITGLEIPMQVNEYAMKVIFKGVHEQEIKQWIQEKGF